MKIKINVCMIFLIFMQILIKEIKSYQNSFLELHSLNRNQLKQNVNPIANDIIQQPKDFLANLANVNTTNIIANITNGLNANIPRIITNNFPTLNDISNITNKFNCFHFNYEDFSVFDLSHLDKIE